MPPAANEPGTDGQIHKRTSNNETQERQSLFQPMVKTLDEERVTWSAIIKVWLKNAARKYHRTRNSIRNGMWPTSINNLYLCCIAFYLLMVVEPSPLLPLTKRLWAMTEQVPLLPATTPEVFRAGMVSILAAFAFICVMMFVRQLLLRCLLAYRGWMFASMRQPPLTIIIWGVLVRLISGYHPSLYSFQRSLPRMSVPPLSETINKLLDSVKCYLEPEEYERVYKEAKQFEKTLGPTLQKLLIVKSWLTQNYVTDWWEKYVYLKGRLPLANYCNYYIMDQSYWRATHKPVARGASLVHNILKFKQLVDHEELPPLLLRDTIPICMAQYERLFSTTRIPKEDIDELVHYDSKFSKHIIVVSKGVYYKLNVYDSDNNPLTAKRLEEHIQFIVDDSEKHHHNICDEEKTISSLTTLERQDWAKIREKLLRGSTPNKRTTNSHALHLIESSIFCLWMFTDEAPTELTERAKLVFQGTKQYQLWFDKCFNIVVFGDGHCGLNCEHSLCDAPAYAHMWEYTLCKDVLECTFDSDGSCFPPMQTYKQAQCKPPQRIQWDITNNDELLTDIRHANAFAAKSNADVDLRIFDHSKWGKGTIKKCRISPDAFVQLSLQLAYYKESAKFVPTYEASMTRLYLNGRTETVRACTQDTCRFVKAMTNGQASKEERIHLLQVAADKHTNLYKDAMNGKGIDRHLFALFVTSQGLGYECDFLKNILFTPWTLSTSQTPHTQQTNVPDPNYESFNDKLCSGGGFMAAAEHGYGVSYLFPNDNRIFFHITSRHSSPHTDTSRFGKLLFESMEEIRSLYDE